MTNPASYNLSLSFPALPLWQGPAPRPGLRRTLPFALTWDHRGFIRQDSPADVVAAVTQGYGDDDYSFITPPPGSSVWADSLGDDMFQRTMAAIARPPRRVLEIGAGSLHVARKLMAAFPIEQYTAVDPALNVSEAGGIEVVRDYFPCAALAGRKFDLIITYNCLEHVPDPEAFLLDMRDSLTEDGRIIAGAPDVEISLRNGDLNVLLHEHLSYFTRSSVRELARRCGLSTVNLDRSADCLWMTWERARRPVNSAPAMMDRLLVTAAQRFYQSLTRSKRQLAAVLKCHDRVAFHGATNGLNNFLYLSGLAGDPRITVFDGDETKAGKYLPTCPNPILPSGDLQYANSPALFVAAMTFYGPIRRYACDRRGLPAERVFPLFGGGRHVAVP
jgi:SAM-dependent methyltransferase